MYFKCSSVPFGCHRAPGWPGPLAAVLPSPPKGPARRAGAHVPPSLRAPRPEKGTSSGSRSRGAQGDPTISATRLDFSSCLSPEAIATSLPGPAGRAGQPVPEWAALHEKLGGSGLEGT